MNLLHCLTTGASAAYSARYRWCLPVSVLALFMLGGCASTFKITGGEKGARISAAQAEAYDGPKARITVGSIIDKSGDAGKRSLGQQLRAMNRLSKTGDVPDAVSVTSGIRDMLTTPYSTAIASSYWSAKISRMYWWSRIFPPPAGSVMPAHYPWAALKAPNSW